MADFYRKVPRRPVDLPYQAAASNLIQSRKLFIDDDEEYDKNDDQLALESEIIGQLTNVEDNLVDVDSGKQILFLHKMACNVFCVDGITSHVSDLEDQIAMESLDKHLKMITQLPSGLKHKVNSDLIRKLTTVSPAPLSN